MYEYEYNNIIDYWSKQFHIYVGNDDRKSIINLYKNNEEQFSTRSIDFNSICGHVILRTYCDLKYPTLNLYESVFTLPALN